MRRLLILSSEVCAEHIITNLLVDNSNKNVLPFTEYTKVIPEKTLSQLIFNRILSVHQMDRVKRIWYLSPMRAAKVQASLRIRAVSPEPSLLAHTSSESRRTFRQKARSLAPLNGWACAVKICHDGMLEDTNSLGAAQMTNAACESEKDSSISGHD